MCYTFNNMKYPEYTMKFDAVMDPTLELTCSHGQDYYSHLNQ